MTKIIGLTGGIGSGKTIIANLFLEQGIPIYIADDEARKITQSTEITAKIRTVFGNEVFENNLLSREKLAKIVFNDDNKLGHLNAIIHPAVKNHFQEWMLSYKTADLIIYEAAILFETGRDKEFDFIITVVAPIEIRIQRVMVRDKTTREAVMQRMNMQWTDEERILKSDFIIENNDNIKKVKIEVVKILNFLRNQ